MRTFLVIVELWLLVSFSFGIVLSVLSLIKDRRDSREELSRR